MRRNKSVGEKMKREVEEAEQKEDDAIIMNNSIVKNNIMATLRFVSSIIRFYNCKNVNKCPLWRVKCYKIKIKPGINRTKSGALYSPWWILDYYFARSFVARKINFSNSPRAIKHHFIVRLINSYYYTHVKNSLK